MAENNDSKTATGGSTNGNLPSRMPAPSLPDREKAVAMAGRLLSQFSPQNGLDPRAFLTAIASILMHYPIAIGEEITDPFHGLPSQLKFPPAPYDVRQACDALMPKPSFSEAWTGRSCAQLKERAQLEQAPRPKKTIAEIEDGCAARGIFMSGWLARQGGLGADGRPHGETPETVRAKFGLTPEQWAALPNAHPRAP
jgi:hypothetical protein